MRSKKAIRALITAHSIYTSTDVHNRTWHITDIIGDAIGYDLWCDETWQSSCGNPHALMAIAQWEHDECLGCDIGDREQTLKRVIDKARSL